MTTLLAANDNTKAYKKRQIRWINGKKGVTLQRDIE